MKKIFRVMIEEEFWDVEADSEDGAMNIAWQEHVAAGPDGAGLISWEIDPQARREE